MYVGMYIKNHRLPAEQPCIRQSERERPSTSGPLAAKRGATSLGVAPVCGVQVWFDRDSPDEVRGSQSVSVSKDL